MKIALRACGILLILMGAVWFLQGINVLPGSFMSGHVQWSFYGTIAAIVGLVLLLKRSP